MNTLTIQEICNLIKDQHTFEAEAADGSFRIKINRYVPFCCMAIHNGSKLRPELKSKTALQDYERWYEEDPLTGSFIASLPITLIAMDSRFEYDLNRSPETCIYEEAWGKQVWKRPLTTKEMNLSKQKHAQFYTVVSTLIQTLEHMFGASVVYDIHSYNYKRWNRNVPLFNIGAERLNMDVHSHYVSHWKEELSKIKLSGVINKTEINDVFFGRGYNLEYITKNHPNTLVLATEIKKVYCDEETSETYPKLIKELQQKLKRAIINNAQFFIEQKTSWQPKYAVNLLDKKFEPSIAKLDKQLYRLLKNFELLAYVNPTNASSEEKKFFKSKYTEPPKFKYAPIKIHPFELKQQLASFNTKEISDISIRHLYESVINSYFDKIDLLASLNSKKFLYNSLRYFGRPSKKDLRNAMYLLHLPPVTSEPVKTPYLPIEEAVEIFKQGLADYEINCKVEFSNKVISQVMVLNSKKTILIRPDAAFTRKEISALIEHEIGVHMVTTQNSSEQKLKVLNLGLPVNTMTQEGLAILSEYLSGNITLSRLRKIAFRVVITDMMCSGATFKECFNYLVYQQNVSEQEAYVIVTRIFRGGGFTKDYLYLNGFVKVLKLWNANTNLEPLLVGKTSLEFYDTIKEMIERDMISKPKYVTKSIVKSNLSDNHSIYEYIVSGLV